MVQPKKTPQLKPHAQVLGKFTVERELDSQLEAAIRERTQQAERQKHERKIQLLDEQPPPMKAAQTKKSKHADKPPKSKPAGFAPPADPRNLSAAPSHHGSRVVSPRILSPRPPARESSSPPNQSSTKSRLIHYVALDSRTEEQMLRAVAGENPTTRKEVTQLIPKVSIRRLVNAVSA